MQPPALRRARDSSWPLPSLLLPWLASLWQRLQAARSPRRCRPVRDRWLTDGMR